MRECQVCTVKSREIDRLHKQLETLQTALERIAEYPCQMQSIIIHECGNCLVCVARKALQ